MMDIKEYRKCLAAITNDELVSDLEKEYAREQLKVIDEAEKRQSPFLRAYIKNCIKCEEADGSLKKYSGGNNHD